MKISTLRNIKNIKENFSFKLETPISEIALALKDKKIRTRYRFKISC